MAEEPLFAGITEPTELRREILNSSKMAIDSLKRFERISIIREQKAKFAAELTKVVREINTLNKKLIQGLPKTTVKPKPLPTKIIEEKTKLADLEDELARVEEKLRGLER
jgi:predicted  nucleic acid-binding Zn-ribbon protein